MTKQSIKVNEIIERQTNDGRTYYQVESNKGRMSCWDKDTVGRLIASIDANMEVEVNVVQKQVGDKTYLNIQKDDYKPKQVETVAGIPVVQTKPMTEQSFVSQKQEHVVKSDSRTATMYTSYAKDIFIELLKDIKGDKPCFEASDEGFKMIMDMAISMVKQAKEAFS